MMYDEKACQGVFVRGPFLRRYAGVLMGIEEYNMETTSAFEEILKEALDKIDCV